MKTEITKWEVTGEDSRGDRSTFFVAAPTGKAAAGRCSGKFKATGKIEKIPYKYAAVVAAVIAALGAGWDAEPNSDQHAETGFWLFRADGVRLYFTGPAYHHPKAYHVSANGRGETTNGEIVNVETPDGINIGAGKTPEQIARDISRRILPDAERVTVLLAERVTLANEAANARGAVVAALSAALGAKSERKGEIYSSFCTFIPSHDGSTVSIKTYGLRSALALKIAALVGAEGEE